MSEQEKAIREFVKAYESRKWSVVAEGGRFVSLVEFMVEYCRGLKSKWHELKGETPIKDQRMDMTQDNFHRVIAMHDELIHEQKDEIAKLKHKINQLQQKKGNNNEN